MDSLAALEVLLLFVFVFGAVTSVVLWRSHRDPVYKKIVLFWLANIGQMLLVALVQGKTDGSLSIEGAVAISWVGATMVPVLISIVQELNDIAIPGKWLVRLSLFGVPAT